MAFTDLQRKLNAARQSLLAHESGRALAQYDRLTRRCPREAVLWAEYGNAASGAGQVDLADRNWQRALGLAPGNADLVGMIGHQYQGMRQPEKALACFVQAAAADLQSGILTQGSDDPVTGRQGKFLLVLLAFPCCGLPP